MLHHCWAPSWAQMCDEASLLLTEQPSDPLTYDAIVTPGPAHARSFSQQLASGRAGIAAGFQFFGPDALMDAILDLPDDDPWRGVGLLVVDEIDADPDTFALASRYLKTPEERPGRRIGTANRFAGLLRRYERDVPSMLQDWATGRDVDAHGEPLPEHQAWQAELWRRLIATTGIDPVQRRLDALAGVEEHGCPIVPRRIVLLDVTDSWCDDAQLWQSLAHHHDVHAWTLTSPPDRTDFAATYTHRVHREPRTMPSASTMLEAIQTSIATGVPLTEPVIPDHSFEIHASHDKDRQVEVMRDVLCRILVDNPDLEPRDIRVLCTDLPAYAPYIHASFGLGADETLHPGHRLRVQVAGASLELANPALDAITAVLHLMHSRADIDQLVDLCSMPAVTRKFGFREDDMETLVALITKSGVRWGVDQTTRARYGVSFGQSTWISGINNLLLALTLTPGANLREATPTAGVEIGHARLIGSLAELVSRVRKVCWQAQTPTTPREWAARLREACQLLVELPFEDSWALAAAYAAFLRLENRPDVSLGVGDIIDILRSESHTGRPNYGNGSLLVTSMRDAQAIEAQVIVVLGLSDDTFPGIQITDGDDVAAAERRWSEQIRQLHQQCLADALMSARRAFIVVTQGATAETGTTIPCPIAIHDLAQLAGSSTVSWPDMVTWHSLTPYGSREFDLSTFDAQATEAARSFATPVIDKPNPAWTYSHGFTHMTSVRLEELEAFIRDPAKALLKTRARVSLTDYGGKADSALPIMPGALDQWKIGDAILRSLIDGEDVRRVEELAHLSTDILPVDSSREQIEKQVRIAQSISDQVRGLEESSSIDIDVSLADVTLVGHVTAHGDTLAMYRYGRPKSTDLVQLWVKLLACTAAGRRMNATAIGTRRFTLVAPSQDQAREILRDLIHLYERGMDCIVPLPLNVAGERFGLIATSRASYRGLEKQFSYLDGNWTYFFPTLEALLNAPSEPDDPGPSDEKRRLDRLATWLMSPIKKNMRP